MVEKKRILVWGLSNNRAGTEAVIHNYAKLINAVSFDFLTFEQPDNYQDLFTKDRDNRYYVICPKTKNPLRYYADLIHFMKAHAQEYTALWFNTNHAANIDLLKLAKRFGISRRIVHSHNSQDPQERLLRLLAHHNVSQCVSLATDRWACSTQAGEYLFGSQPFRLVPNLVDANARKYDATKRRRIREKLGMDNTLVIGTVGRLSFQKNQEFLIAIAKKLRSQNIAFSIVIVGNGELHDKLTTEIRESNLSGNILLVGSQPDVQAYLSAFDIFAFPSRFEGLPLALLEAQFNGLPCVVSDAIPTDAFISHDLVQLSLANIDEWVTAVTTLHRSSQPQLTNRANLYDLHHQNSNAEKLFLI